MAWTPFTRLDYDRSGQLYEAFFHCGKAMIRSGMWQPDSWGDIGGLSTYAEALMDQARPPLRLSELEERLAHNETDRLY